MFCKIESVNCVVVFIVSLGDILFLASDGCIEASAQRATVKTNVVGLTLTFKIPSLSSVIFYFTVLTPIVTASPLIVNVSFQVLVLL